MVLGVETDIGFGQLSFEIEIQRIFGGGRIGS